MDTPQEPGTATTDEPATEVTGQQRDGVAGGMMTPTGAKAAVPAELTEEQLDKVAGAGAWIPGQHGF